MKRLLIVAIMTLLITGCAKKEDTQEEVVKEDIQEEVKETVKNDYEINSDKNFTKGNNIFAWGMLKELEKEDGKKNIFFSPIINSTAMTMVYEGADGNTADEIKNTLGYGELDKESINKNYTDLTLYLKNMKNVTLDVNNSIWFGENKIEKVEAEFEDISKTAFNADIYREDFGSEETVSKINKWVSDSTKGKINEIIDQTNPDTVAYIINAIYFKGDWSAPFDIENTAKENFNNLNGSTATIDMMNKVSTRAFYEDESLKATKIPYTGNEMSMHCILPKEGTAKELVESMTEERWSKIKNSYKYIEVDLKLPKFESKYEKKVLNQSLQNLGIVSAFDGGLADFSKMGTATSGNNIFIGEVLHTALIEVNEEGSVAVAVEEDDMIATSMDAADEEPEKAEFFADKPFIYLIEDEKTGNILFAGVLKDMK